jgi:hypothetical protein
MKESSLSHLYKQKQHYVWKTYLIPWAVNGQIWCKRNDKIYWVSLENIAQERYFYKTSMLNEFENSWIKSLIKNMDPSSHEMNLNSYEVYKSTANGHDYFEKNGIEEYHTIIENTAIEPLEYLYKKDLSFLHNDQIKINFCQYLGHQYTRTKRNREKVSAGLTDVIERFPEYKEKVDPVKISNVLSLILPNAIGNWIYTKAKFSFIENTTEVDFITGDQPIFNVEANGLNVGDTPEKMKLYYPLSPRLAILMTEDESCFDGNNIEVVKELNNFIYDGSYNQIYSQKKELLELYLKN